MNGAFMSKQSEKKLVNENGQPLTPPKRDSVFYGCLTFLARGTPIWAFFLVAIPFTLNSLKGSIEIWNAISAPSEIVSPSEITPVPLMGEGKIVGQRLDCSLVNRTNQAQLIIKVVLEVTFIGDSSEKALTGLVYPSQSFDYTATTLRPEKRVFETCLEMKPQATELFQIYFHYPNCTYVAGTWKIKTSVVLNGRAEPLAFNECEVNLNIGDKADSNTKLLDLLLDPKTGELP